MNFVKIRMTFAFALVLVMTATGLWAAGAEEEPAAAADKKYVTDPSTGKVVVAPEYGGTLTYASHNIVPHTDAYFHHHPGEHVSSVVEKLTMLDWAAPRDVFNIRTHTSTAPLSLYKGHLAESWEKPDDTTFIFHIRKGVHWHNKPPMNGRELTADDVVYNYHRMTGLGSGFTEPSPTWTANLYLVESITATDKYTVVFKQTKVDPTALFTFTQHMNWIYPPEVIKQHGDMKDWRNLVGTGPYELTDWVEGSSVTWTKNPDYWGFDEKYPQNRLPYVDSVTKLIMPDAATRLAALRSGKVDALGMPFGDSQLGSIDQVDSLKRTNPEIVLEPMSYRSETSWVVNPNVPPFDDNRVRHALQMALDLETINNTYWKGFAETTPMGYLGSGLIGYVTPFEDWPEEIKQYYRYDPEGAEKLLDEAGYPRGADGIRFKTVLDLSVPWQVAAYHELAASYWDAIGVDVEIVENDGPTVGAKRREGTFEIQAFISGNDWDPLEQIKQFYTPAASPYNSPNVKDPAYDALVAPVLAADTIEERQRLIKPVEKYMNEQHWYIWGSRVPQFHALQPWVIGYNGETGLGDMDRVVLLARLWIDSELKKAKGH